MNTESFNFPVFGFVGRLSTEKGVDRVLKSISNLKNEFKFLYLVVGDGPEKSKLLNLVDEYQINDYVKFFGFQNNPYKYMNLFDCYICSSTGEGLSTTCIESSLLHKHIISTDVSGATEIILEPEIGVVVDNTQEAIENAMKNYLQKKYDLKNWDNNFKKANEKWSKQNILLKFDGIIGEFVND